WEPANVERLRRALELAGEPDPVGLIAERLSGRSPFMATDMSSDGDDFPPFDAPSPEADGRTPVEEQIAAAGTIVASEEAMAAPASIAPAPAPTAAVPGPASVASRAATAHAQAETVEVDLSI